jgi:hypothetical protein
MTHNLQIVDMIERANDAQPICPCGWHTTAVWRDGAVWLECASINQPHGSRLRRALAAVTAQVHTHERIVDAPPAAADRVTAGLP